MTRNRTRGGLLILAATFAVTLTSCNFTEACEAYRRGQATGPGMSAAGFGPRMSCVAGLEFEGRFYAATQSQTSDVGDEVPGAVIPGCNDTGGNLETDTPITAYRVGNYCTTDVLAVGGGDIKTLYVPMR